MIGSKRNRFAVPKPMEVGFRMAKSKMYSSSMKLASDSKNRKIIKRTNNSKPLASSLAEQAPAQPPIQHKAQFEPQLSNQKDAPEIVKSNSSGSRSKSPPKSTRNTSVQLVYHVQSNLKTMENDDEKQLNSLDDEDSSDEAKKTIVIESNHFDKLSEADFKLFDQDLNPNSTRLSAIFEPITDNSQMCIIFACNSIDQSFFFDRHPAAMQAIVSRYFDSRDRSIKSENSRSFRFSHLASVGDEIYDHLDNRKHLPQSEALKYFQQEFNSIDSIFEMMASETITNDKHCFKEIIEKNSATNEEFRFYQFSQLESGKCVIWIDAKFNARECGEMDGGTSGRLNDEEKNGHSCMRNFETQIRNRQAGMRFCEFSQDEKCSLYRFLKPAFSAERLSITLLATITLEPKVDEPGRSSSTTTTTTSSAISGKENFFNNSLRSYLYRLKMYGSELECNRQLFGMLRNSKCGENDFAIYEQILLNNSLLEQNLIDTHERYIEIQSKLIERFGSAKPLTSISDKMQWFRHYALIENDPYFDELNNAAAEQSATLEDIIASIDKLRLAIDMLDTSLQTN